MEKLLEKLPKSSWKEKTNDREHHQFYLMR